jgi:hypothetical protein
MQKHQPRILAVFVFPIACRSINCKMNIIQGIKITEKSIVPWMAFKLYSTSMFVKLMIGISTFRVRQFQYVSIFRDSFLRVGMRPLGWRTCIPDFSDDLHSTNVMHISLKIIFQVYYLPRLLLVFPETK